MEQPHIFIKVLEDGRANYDIAMASVEAEEDESTVELMSKMMSKVRIYRPDEF